jgi:hypothetical protein
VKAGLRIEGFDDVDRRLVRLDSMTDVEALKDIGIDALEPVADTARALVRRRTGRLANSIHAGDQLSPAQSALHYPEPGTVEVYAGPGPLPQAITEEFGTVHEGAHPYMRPAWDSRVSDVQDRLQNGLGKRLDRIVKG